MLMPGIDLEAPGVIRDVGALEGDVETTLMGSGYLHLNSVEWYSLMVLTQAQMVVRHLYASFGEKISWNHLTKLGLLDAPL